MLTESWNCGYATCMLQRSIRTLRNPQASSSAADSEVQYQDQSFGLADTASIKLRMNNKHRQGLMSVVDRRFG